jgi:Fe-Mn family superoxide dismutase
MQMQMTLAKTDIVLPALPYAEDALEPVISARTISYHYGKHHAGYVATLNKLITSTSFANLTLEAIVLQSAKNSKTTAIFHNAAQIWNHNFYWLSMAAKGGGEPSGKLKQSIEKDFGSFQDFRNAFIKAAEGEFGSGWVWLIENPEGKLQIVATDNADHGRPQATDEFRRVGTRLLSRSPESPP